jgi:uncharacterized protein
MVTRQDALRLVREAGCSEEVVRHLLEVERVSLSIARKIRRRGHNIDLGLVSLGALLHDIGRARTHGIAHGVVGGKILREHGLNDFATFAERHIGAGIPAGEAKKLGLPARDFVPKTIEEKIVAYADKFVMGSRRSSYRHVLEWFKSELGPEHPAIDRFKQLHAEIQALMKNSRGGPAET